MVTVLCSALQLLLCSLVSFVLVPAPLTAHIIVYDKNNQTLQRIADEPAYFGPDPTDPGTWGLLVYADPPEACSPIKPPPTNTTPYIALIKRNKCNFDVKVLSAQNVGYVAAIVHNVGDDSLLPMHGGDHADDVDIISVFISESDGLALKADLHKPRYRGLSVVINDTLPLDPEVYLLPFAIVVGICFVVMVMFVCVKWILNIRRKRRSRLSKSSLNKVPTKKFQKGDPYDVCAVCLDEYEDGEKLRILPCSHAYHQKCIDPWLTKNKRTCPLCKKKVFPGSHGDDSSSSSEAESDMEGRSNENTALLGATRGRRSRTTGNTFDNSGLPSGLRGLVHHVSDSDDDSLDSLSQYQSSVEVHRHSYGPTPPTLPPSHLTTPPGRLTTPAGHLTTPPELEGAVGGLEDTSIELVEDHFYEVESVASSAGVEVLGQQTEVRVEGNIQEGLEEDDDHSPLLLV